MNTSIESINSLCPETLFSQSYNIISRLLSNPYQALTFKDLPYTKLQILSKIGPPPLPLPNYLTAVSNKLSFVLSTGCVDFRGAGILLGGSPCEHVFWCVSATCIFTLRKRLHSCTTCRLCL